MAEFNDKRKVESLDSIALLFAKEFEANSKESAAGLQEALSIFYKKHKGDFDKLTRPELLIEIRKMISKNFKASVYDDSLLKYIRSFNQVDELNAELHLNFNGIDIDFKLLSAEKQAVIEQVANQYSVTTYKDEYLRRLQNVMRVSIGQNASIAQTQGLIKRFINDSTYGNYVGFNGVMQYDGAINAKIAEVYELDAYYYVGSIVEASRAQCKRWVAKRIIPIAQLPSEISWGYNNGSGMIEGTDVGNFAQYRGGYNCRHRAFPTRSK